MSLEMYTNGTRKILGKGFITNLSESGAALETPKNLRMGEKVLLRFSLPNDWSFDLPGEIIYSKDGVLTRAYGARFEGVAAETAEKLKNYLVVNVSSEQ